MGDNTFNPAKPGVYITLSKTKPSSSEIDFSYTVPLGEGEKSISFTTRNDFSKPIQQFFEFLGQQSEDIINNILRNMGPTALTSIYKTVKSGTRAVSDIFGIKFYKEGYYAQAWKGSSPPDFNLTLNFFLGMWGKWNAKEEVYMPIKRIAESTFPISKGLILTAPMANAWDVFTAYGNSYVDFFKRFLRNSEGEANSSETLKDLNSGGGGGTYRISYDYFTKESDKTSKYNILVFPTVIIKSASPSLTAVVDEEGYPISGSISINGTAQSLFVKKEVADETAVFTRG